MSVHGEYARALAGLLERLDTSRLPGRDESRRALEGAHANETRDLSTAARCARSVLDRIEASCEASGGEAGLRDACDHLRAHCQAILGGMPLGR